MIVLTDTNELATSPKTIARLKEYFGKENVIVCNITKYAGVTAGDVNVPLDDGTILAIERKTPTDFLSSITGHLQDQVEAMSRHAKYYSVIVTGSIQYGMNNTVLADHEITGWKANDVRGLVRAIQFAGCSIEYCPEDSYPMVIEEIYKTVNKPDEHQRLRRNRIITFPPLDERIQILAQFPGGAKMKLGIKSATSLLKFAGTMDKNADEDGYGTLASAVHWATILVQIDQGSRPSGWSANKILTFRKMWGLASNEYIGVIAEEKEKEPF